MRPRLRTLMAALSALPLALTLAPSAHAADPTTMTNGFYVDPDGSAKRWVAANPNDGRASAIDASIANTPTARWFGSWSGAIDTAVGAYAGAADSADKLPLLVAYNMYNRDYCGGHSAGGASSPSDYANWISRFAGGIGDRPAVVILEPDSLGDYGCMNQAQIDERENMLTGALAQFSRQAPNTWVYMDAGNPGWASAQAMAGRLHEAGLRQARGFSLNVSNYFTTAENIAYGEAVNRELSSRYGYTKPFVVDTSRNGNGSNGEWCNPAGRRPAGWGCRDAPVDQGAGRVRRQLRRRGRFVRRAVPPRGRLQDDPRLLTPRLPRPGASCPATGPREPPAAFLTCGTTRWPAVCEAARSRACG